MTPVKRPTRHPVWVGTSYIPKETHGKKGFYVKLDTDLQTSVCFQSQGNRSRAKTTAVNPNPPTWVRPTQEGSVPLQCPPSTPREIITDKRKLNLSGAGTIDPHRQVSSPTSAVSKLSIVISKTERRFISIFITLSHLLSSQDPCSSLTTR